MYATNDFPHVGEEVRRFLEWTLPNAEERRRRVVRMLGGETRNKDKDVPSLNNEPSQEPSANPGSALDAATVEMLVEAAAKRARRSENIIRGLVGSARDARADHRQQDMSQSSGFRYPDSKPTPTAPAEDESMSGTTAISGPASLFATRYRQSETHDDYPSPMTGTLALSGSVDSFEAHDRQSEAHDSFPSDRGESFSSVLNLSVLFSKGDRPRETPESSVYLQEIAGNDEGPAAEWQQPAWRRMAGSDQGLEPAGSIGFPPNPAIVSEGRIQKEFRHETHLGVAVPDAAFLKEGHASWSMPAAIIEAGRPQHSMPTSVENVHSRLFEETRLREMLADIIRTDALRHGLVLKER